MEPAASPEAPAAAPSNASPASLGALLDTIAQLERAIAEARLKLQQDFADRYTGCDVNPLEMVEQLAAVEQELQAIALDLGTVTALRQEWEARLEPLLLRGRQLLSTAVTKPATSTSAPSVKTLAGTTGQARTAGLRSHNYL